MATQIYDINTVGYSETTLGGFYDFYLNNAFYLFAPEYYFNLYCNYFNRCMTAYDGWCKGIHNIESGFVPQKMLQSVATGLTNMFLGKGIDFSGDKASCDFANKWARETNFYLTLKKAHKFSIAGGTSLLKLNRINNKLFATSHRIDTFYPDIDAYGNIIRIKVFYDVIHGICSSGDMQSQKHYGICEERYFDEDNCPRVKNTIYEVAGNLQTSVLERKFTQSSEVPYDKLPPEIQKQVKEHYPDIIFRANDEGEDQKLPFDNSLGCYLLRFTEDLPQVSNLPFGQPIGDILWTENFQYDQIKYFEKNEVDLARARALIPETFWNKDDEHYENRALSDRFYQKVSSVNEDMDKITPIQFLLRGNDMKTVKENIFKDASFKLNISASSFATFLSEGSGARTATEINSEKTKTDTWIEAQKNINATPIDNLLKEVMLYYVFDPVSIIFKAEDQAPYLDKLKVNSDVYTAGNMSPERFVKDTYKNLSVAEQKAEINYLKRMAKLKEQRDIATNQFGVPTGL